MGGKYHSAAAQGAIRVLVGNNSEFEGVLRMDRENSSSTLPRGVHGLQVRLQLQFPGLLGGNAFYTRALTV